VTTTSTRIESSGGLHLEAEFDRMREPRAGLVVCHAHPGMQGTMNSPLLLAIRDALVQRDWSVLRFNFRGVGGSEGDFGDGLEEVDDAVAGVQFIRGEHPDAPVAILGWSFGASVAMRAAAREPEIEACVAIAPSVAPKEGISRGVPSPRELGLEVPLLIVCGANDDVTPPHAAREWAAEAGALYEEIGAANHFFWAKYDQLIAAVTGFLEEAV
jgi:alpha/beta superfamily hydrolase